MRASPFSLLAASLFIAAPALRAQTPSAQSASAPQPPAAPSPEVGQPAPDFTLPLADARGPRSTPVTLSSLRGKVVVVAFYPKDRTTGCTAELTKFRDEYTGLFGPRAGSDVVLLPISADGLASHTAWAKDAKFPFALAADTALTTATAYGSKMTKMPLASRTVFVVGKDGRVTYRDLKFNALSEDAYAQLKAAVAAAQAATPVVGATD